MTLLYDFPFLAVAAQAGLSFQAWFLQLDISNTHSWCGRSVFHGIIRTPLLSPRACHPRRFGKAAPISRISAICFPTDRLVTDYLARSCRGYRRRADMAPRISRAMKSCSALFSAVNSVWDPLPATDAGRVDRHPPFRTGVPCPSVFAPACVGCAATLSPKPSC